jgi:CRP-like cAMP-binding protein
MCSLSLSKRTMFTGGAHEDEVSRRSLVSEQEEKKTVSQQVAMFQSGAVFGEWGLMQDIPRSATVTSLSKCVLMVITRDAYRSVLADYRRQCWRIDRCILALQSNAAQRSAKDMEAVVDNLSQAESLSVAKDVKEAFCAVASYRFVERECNVYPQGVAPDGFYYLIRGSVRVSWDLKDEVAQRHRASRTSIKSMQGARGSTAGRGSHSHGRGRGSAGIAAMMKQMGYRGSKSFSRQQSLAAVDSDPFATSSARGSHISMLEEVDDENLPKIEQSLRARLTRLANEKAARKSKRRASNVLKMTNQKLDDESDEDADEVSFGDEFRGFMTKILPDVEEMANCGSLEYSKLDSAKQKQRESIDPKSVLIKEVNIDGLALQDAQDKADKDTADNELTEDEKERDGESSMSPANSKKKQSVVEGESANPASPNASSGNRVTLVGTKEHKAEDEEVLGESDYATLIAKAKVFNTKLKHWSRLGSKRQQYSENLHVPDHAELGLIVAGEIFGYQDVVDECMRPVSVDAIDDCDLLFVPSSHVKRILKQQTTIGLRGAIVDILLAHLPHYEHQRYLLDKLVVYFQIETRCTPSILNF